MLCLSMMKQLSALLVRDVPGFEQGEEIRELFSTITELTWAVVVAQLVERSLQTSEIHSSNPYIGKILATNCTIEKTKIKKKRPGMAQLKKKFGDNA